MAVSSQHVATSKHESWQDLKDKIVMVTGASSGIGWELCIDLAKSGCKIIAAARRIHRLKALCDEINSFGIADCHTNPSGVLALAVQLDVSADGPAIEASVRKAWDAFGRIDALINNAGITGTRQSSLDTSQENWDHTFKTNVRGSWLVTKYVCVNMRDFGQGGSIINISSTAALNRTHHLGLVAYISSKAAVDTMTKVMAMELGKHKIRVNSIAPGLFESEITKELMQKKWIKNVAFKTMPMKEFGKIDPTMTTLVRFLIHESSGYITGNIFAADAGYSLPGVPLYSSL
ncbi:putative L-xylulose reductase [Helianthus annuus]|nr:putative L-xylulose reductase [Helianthus annuus]